MKLYDKNIIYHLKDTPFKPHIGEYFQVISFNDKYYLYYNCLDTIKLVISNTLSFIDKPPITVIKNAPGGNFCIIQKDNMIYMLCGSHVSNQEKNELEIPDLVWPKVKRTITNYNESRPDRKNGIYLLYSKNGIKWKSLNDLPVMNSVTCSESCKLGEVCTDTSPCIFQNNDEFYYYGRLNSSLDERRIYLRRSKDMINWSLPIRIEITNEEKIKGNHNYYMPVIFKHSGIFYMFTPYFEACGTESRKSKNGKTLLLKSINGINWQIIDECLPHEGKYCHRVNDVIKIDNKFFIFYRENLFKSNLPQDLVSYTFTI